MPLCAAACLIYSSYLGLPVLSITCSTVGSGIAPDCITIGCVTTIVGVAGVAALAAAPLAACGFCAAAALASSVGLTVSLIKTSVGVRASGCATPTASAFIARRAS